MPRRSTEPAKRPAAQSLPADRQAKDSSEDFISVARRLECDDDKERFEAKLRKIAKADSKGPREGR
jgi:hypothetical protein